MGYAIRRRNARQITIYNSVEVMPLRGSFDNVVLDWTPDSEKVLFRANQTTFGDRKVKYYTININRGMEQSLPIVNGGFATFHSMYHRYVSFLLIVNFLPEKNTKEVEPLNYAHMIWIIIHSNK